MSLQAGDLYIQVVFKAGFTVHLSEAAVIHYKTVISKSIFAQRVPLIKTRQSVAVQRDGASQLAPKCQYNTPGMHF